MMDNCCAPQWADFTCSPQVPSDSYFEVEHSVHKPQIHYKPMIKSKLPFNEESVKETSVNETKFDDSLESETMTNSVCTNVAYFIPHNNERPVGDTKKEHGSSKSENKKSSKIHQTWNISITELTSASKVPMVQPRPKPILPERIKKSVHVSEVKNKMFDKSSMKTIQGNDAKKKNNVQVDATKIQAESLDESKIDNYVKDNVFEKGLSYKIVTMPRRQSGSFKMKQPLLGKSQPKVLTCQYRRRSLMKYRRHSKQFISLAEAISKFQNGTPQRFRTLCKKDLKPAALMKLKRSPLKLTLPVSPALRCKQRIRQTTTLSTQEREKLELEEMKKYQIKANPVPVNILKGPSVLKKVAKKPATVTEEFRLTQSKKTRHTSAQQMTSQEIEKDSKNVVASSHSVSASNIVKKESTTEQSTESIKAMRLNFETRNKKFHINKEGKLKVLQDQETNKAKSEFHAKPAPKFLKATNPVKEQNSIKKKSVIPCPFSFEERNKSLAKKKEELIKQMQEQDRKSRVFHANPVPNFKPVIVRGSSKENLRSKDKTHNSKELITRQTKSCNDQENKQPNIITNTVVATDAKKKEVKQNIATKNTEKKQIKSNTDAVDAKGEKLNISQKKNSNFKLNTDKRAKERSEFDEIIKKKEQELEAKRLEEEKNRLLKEKLEKAELRKRAEIKATPMPIYKPPIVIKSTKPPTEPQSPLVRSRSRVKTVS